MNKALKTALKVTGITAGALTAAAGLYVLSVGGRTNHPDLKKLGSYRYAHRGYHDKPQIPENSLPAFRRALERGWGAELDVHLLKDGTLAVAHDSDLLRCTGVEGRLEDLTYAEMKQLRLEGTQEQMPTFDEVLALFDGKTPLIIELKTAGGNHKELAQAVCERLDSYVGDFCIESFDPMALLAVKKLRPNICRGQLCQDFRKNKEDLDGFRAFLLDSLVLNSQTRPDFVAYKFADRDNLPLRLCTKLWGVQEVSWTIRDRDTMAEAEEDGCVVIFEKFDPEAQEDAGKTV